MGAVTFNIDSKLLDALCGVQKFDMFCETGTFHGDTVELARPHFPRLISIELSESLHAEATKRFQSWDSIEIRHGSSARILNELRGELSAKSVFYYLDAHWCVAVDTAGQASQCPLLDELAAIRVLNEESVVLIDDARLFLAPPAYPHEVSQWPGLDEIIRSLRALSDAHRIAVVNDVIVFFPAAMSLAVERYARDNGVDWLQAFKAIECCSQLKEKITAKDIVIEKMQQITNPEGIEKAILEIKAANQSELEAKEKIIREQENALKAYRAAFFFVRPVMPALRSIRNLSRLFYPKLGRLEHHAPLPLEKPAQREWEGARNAPRISIVTPSFRQAHFIEETMDSVLDQNYPSLDYFVQDGASDDGTVDILKRYGTRLSGWESIRDGGQSEAINLGFAKTSGEIMAWLNSDDLLMPGSLATVAEYFEAHPEVDVVYGHRILIDEKSAEIGRWVLPSHDDGVLSWADFVPQETLFWRRSIWERAGGRIDESYRFAMDWDLLLRFRSVGARMVRLPDFLGAFRIHSTQKTSAQINEIGMKEMARLRRRALGHDVGWAQIRRALMPYLIKHVAHDLAYRIKR
jgi:GT2 family glycosyltransferase